MEKKINSLTTNEKENLLSKTPYILPDNPSSKNFSASQIKRTMYEGYVVLFDIVNKLIDLINENVDLSNDDVEEINTHLTTIYGYFTNGKANYAINDKNGNDIYTTYETKSDATDKLNNALGQLNTLITNLANGTNIPARASADESGNNIKDTYLRYLNMTGTQQSSSVQVALAGRNGGGTTSATTSVQINGATEYNAGVMSASDKSRLDAVTSDIATSLATAKGYTDDKVARSNLVSVLGEASQSVNGLLSTEDKRRLDVLYSLLGETSDGDTVVNTIKEVLDIFASYPEGTTVVQALALKVSIADIVDNLTSTLTTKPLSANQGKVLKGLIDALTTVVDTKANASDVYDKTAVDNKLALKANSADVYTKSEVNDIVDGFVFADIDNELDDESTNPVQNAVITEELDKKANIDGNYPTMTVGQAEGIVSNREIEDADVSCQPITFGIAGGEAEIQTGINKFEYLEGKSVKFNQLVQNGNFADTSSWEVFGGSLTVSSNVATYTISSAAGTNRIQQSITTVLNHKYLMLFDVKSNKTSKGYIHLGIGGFTNTFDIKTSWERVGIIITATTTTEPFRIYVNYAGNYLSNNDTVDFRNAIVFDLTAMGLDSITTVDEFKTLFPLDYYPYNAGSILSAKAYQLISRGKNQFSELNTYIPVIGGEEYEISGISAGGILTQYDANKNLIATSETFTDTVDITLEDNARYVKINATTYEDIMFYLTFPEDGGVYNEPYVEPRVETVNLPNIELRSVGDVKDIAYATGGGLRRVGSYTFTGNETWTGYSTNQAGVYRYGTTALQDFTKNASSNQQKANIVATNLVTAPSSEIYDAEEDNLIGISESNLIFVLIKSSNNIAQSMSGKTIYYELATPTEIPLSENSGWSESIFVDNFGTLEFLTSPTQVPQVEQPYFIRYTVSLSEFLDTAYVHCEGDGNNIATEKEVEAFRKGTDAVGLARASESLTPYSEESGSTGTTPFVMQTAGGDADISDKAYLRALRGNSVVFNQININEKTNGTINDVSFTKNNDGSWTINGTASANAFKIIASGISLLQSHKYLLKGAYGGSNSTYSLYVDTFAKYDNGEGIIFTANSSATTSLGLRVNNGTVVNNKKVYPQLFDLTLMFGAGNEPTTVAEFNRLFPKPYYAYNAGTLLSTKSNGYKTVGYNQFDGELEQGYIDDTTGQNYPNSSNVRSVGYIKVISGQTYSFYAEDTTNRNRIFYEYDENYNFIKRTVVYYPTISLALGNATRYIRIVYPEPNDINRKIAIYLTWDGSRTGYEPYETNTYALPNIELKSAGNVYDELKPDGTLIRRVGSVDLGTLDWSVGSENRYYAYLADVATVPNGSVKGNLLCPKYITNSADYRENHKTENQMYLIGGSKYLYIVDTKTYADAAAFKSAMSGVYLYYELATPTEEQTSNTFQEITPIDDFGTQEFLYDNDINIPVPQGAEFFYPVDYKAFIDSLYNKVEGDTTEFVTQSDLTTALSTFLTSITGYDATKSQTLKHDNSGNVKWVDD